MISSESRWQASVRIRVIASDGNLVENERMHVPYAREAITSIARPDLQEYTVQSGDTWHNIAARLLRGRSDWWWVIAEFSDIEDPIAELVEGRKLYCPSFASVSFEVMQFDRGEAVA